MRLKGKKILLIDDDEVLLGLLRRVLEVAGCTVIQAQGIKPALKEMEFQKPDLVFLDLSMPELDGFTFLKFRKSNVSLAMIPVIVLSGTQKQEDIDRAYEMGANQFLEKPFNSSIVLQKLRFIFYKQENFSYKLPEQNFPTVDATCYGELIAQCVGRLKLESPVRCKEGKSITLQSESFGQGEDPIICKVEPHSVEISGGLFRTPLSVTGQDSNMKRRCEAWQRGLSE